MWGYSGVIMAFAPTQLPTMPRSIRFVLHAARDCGLDWSHPHPHPPHPLPRALGSESKGHDMKGVDESWVAGGPRVFELHESYVFLID